MLRKSATTLIATLAVVLSGLFLAAPPLTRHARADVKGSCYSGRDGTIFGSWSGSGLNRDFYAYLLYNLQCTKEAGYVPCVACTNIFVYRQEFDGNGTPYWLVIAWSSAQIGADCGKSAVGDLPVAHFVENAPVGTRYKVAADIAPNFECPAYGGAIPQPPGWSDVQQYLTN
jgi:hypothetical protein